MLTDPSVLPHLGLRAGEQVRFRRHEGGRWVGGRLVGVGVDGSLTLHDVDGAARSLRPERVQVRRPGKRGRLVWREVPEVATTWEQLELW
jgi:hypothetical protein